MTRAKVWLKAFDESNDFVVAKPSLTIGAETFYRGDIFDKSLVNTRRLRQLYDSRRISASEIQESTASEPPTDRKVEIVEGNAGWLYVEVNGERFGKATRDRDEAETIALEAMEG